MARSFDIPHVYQSTLIGRIKEARRTLDPLKKDFTPSLLDFGPVQFKLARHFGFCYGVENAVEIAYKALAENPNRRIFLLSEMIHNPHVNDDLESSGIRFLRTTIGEQIIPFKSLTPEDVIIIPAFGTSLEIRSELESLGLDLRFYDTTCPFVEKVWKRSAQLGESDFTVVIHGKYMHEETKATFSHAATASPVIVIRNLEEAKRLAMVITGDLSEHQFVDEFGESCSPGFNSQVDLQRIGVVNQTTMLASETTAISELLREAIASRYGSERVDDHFANTKDTLCYATNENQDAVHALVEEKASVAIVVGGTNSSNTSHLVEICEDSLPTYFVSSAEQIKTLAEIDHFDLRTKTMKTSRNWIDSRRPAKILLAAGASCPDRLIDDVISKVSSFFKSARSPEDVLSDFVTRVS